ncbi:hydantoinase B/oxoprolinase family protein [Fibrella sp. HMF5335]|uniref:Hydantoinase B/oxoprolinase family protein n=1 Tax=Fibrella rubiginis TaxID=2817060 RepID=A0A939GJ26_9BACT|nr:hydantoinase B/oxoprolinase family protein [Fibrella rubiginis]MBO0938159.1 hydantoinase B/oxoprolinase family protein [Fibrella rubiginis]
MWQIWIDTGGTFTDGLARDPNGTFHRTKVLSSARLRGQLIGGRLQAAWLMASIFDGYTLRVVETNETFVIQSLSVAGELLLSKDGHALGSLMDAITEAGGQPDGIVSSLTVELFTGEEAPVLAARLLTQTPLGSPFPALEMRLGTTKGTNALLERRGGRVALLVTKGFRDLLVIGTQQRPDLFQLAIPPAEVLYDTVLEVPARIAADGTELTPLTDKAIAQLVGQLREDVPDVVAISLLNAYQNPAHERQLVDALMAAGFPLITRATALSTAPGYVARTQTTVVDAYLTPVLRGYLTNIQTQLGGAVVRLMTSAGGLVRADLFQPKDSLLSGPAGGVIGAAAIAPHEALLTLDMGGTSTDVARIERNQPDYRFSTPIGPFDLQLPSLAIETVAAGGGSVCWFDALAGQLRVGPQSAGANPGPACYGANAPDAVPLLTITDVNLLLGKLHPRQFGIPIFPEKAQAALAVIAAQVATSTGQKMPSDELLRGFERIANEIMAGAIRKISVARGFDPAQYSLLVFGGAGGLHGCAVAQLLGINRLILPFDGGLLSAYGMGQAKVERIMAQAVLQPLSAFRNRLDDVVAQLANEASTALFLDMGSVVPVEQSATVFLRLKGQEATIGVPLSPTLEADFRSTYQQRYGYLPANTDGQPLEIDVESVRVRVSTVPGVLPESTAIASPRPAKPAFQTDQYPAYDWAQLQPGHTFSGPALLLNTTSSVFVEEGWTVVIQADKTGLIERMSTRTAQSKAADNEVIQLELFTQRFRAIAEEMGAQLQRTAFSVNVKERLDFSCALLDADARLVANAPHIPVHLGSLGICARLVLAKLAQDGTALGPGDVAITNHPAYGGSHLPDVTLLQGVYSANNRIAGPQLIGYVINRAHHAEIGGKTPGSMPPDATSLVEEGVVLEPQFIVRQGEFLWEKGLAASFVQAPYPTRALAENQADLEAALASLRAGETALQNLVQAHGIETVHHYMERLQQSATEAIQAVLARHEGQEFAATESLDDGHQLCTKLTISNKRLSIDFRGTGGVHPNNLNANVSILHSAVLYVLRLWVAQDIPLNEGLMAPVALMLPESSFLNPVFSANPAECPAVVGGNTEVSQRLVDTLLKALGLAACSQGTMNNFLFGNDMLGYYETIGGGAGAVWGMAGRSGVHQHMTNTKLTDPETLERRYPVRLWQFSLRSNSGGAGQWRGGDGLVREIEFLARMQATLLSQHRVQAPYGLNGGQAGAVGCQTLISPSGKVEALPGIFTRQMIPCERICLETPGGGGVGKAE